MIYLVRGRHKSLSSKFVSSFSILANSSPVLIFPHQELDHIDFNEDGIDAQAAINLANRRCLNSVREYLKQNLTVIVHNSFFKLSELEPYLKLAEEFCVPALVITDKELTEPLLGSVVYEPYEGEIFLNESVVEEFLGINNLTL